MVGATHPYTSCPLGSLCQSSPPASTSSCPTTATASSKFNLAHGRPEASASSTLFFSLQTTATALRYKLAQNLAVRDADLQQFLRLSHLCPQVPSLTVRFHISPKCLAHHPQVLPRRPQRHHHHRHRVVRGVPIERPCLHWNLWKTRRRHRSSRATRVCRTARSRRRRSRLSQGSRAVPTQSSCSIPPKRPGTSDLQPHMPQRPWPAVRGRRPHHLTGASPMRNLTSIICSR